MMRQAVMMIICLLQTGCYYMQAAAGQWQVMRQREPIEAVIADNSTPAELAARLELLLEAREFSIRQLRLPDNNSYRSYADLERDYVVWNVFAAPEFSLSPKQWCFPIAGCVSYRGYFSKADAERQAQKLATQGFDVTVGGVVAYSTLGNFNDPVLSTMLQWNDVELVALLFHELAHQLLYVKNDTGFNESFASAVEEIGIERWLLARGERKLMADYLLKRDLRREMVAVIAAAREDLGKLYASDRPAPQMRRAKSERLEQLATDVAKLLRDNGRDDSNWRNAELNNARLISSNLYDGRLPAFRALYHDCGEDLECFYARADALADLDKKRRAAELDALATVPLPD